MRTFFLALAFLAPAAIASASDRMTDVEFLQASRCAAYLGDDAGQIPAMNFAAGDHVVIGPMSRAFAAR